MINVINCEKNEVFLVVFLGKTFLFRYFWGVFVLFLGKNRNKNEKMGERVIAEVARRPWRGPKVPQT